MNTDSGNERVGYGTKYTCMDDKSVRRFFQEAFGMAARHEYRRDIQTTTVSILFLPLLVIFTVGEISARESTPIEGVQHVMNGTVPREGTRVLKLEELWRVGGADDETIFGLLTQVLGDEDGNVYLLDAQLHQVFVYSPEGHLIRSLFREGEGPGEGGGESPRRRQLLRPALGHRRPARGSASGGRPGHPDRPPQ